MKQETGRIIRQKKNFTQVSNIVLRDKTLSLKAKGLYGLINSYLDIPEWTLYKSHLETLCKEGRRAFQASWDELKEHGYLMQRKFKNESGYWCYEYELIDNPHTHFEGVDSEGVDFEGVENVGAIKNTYSNNTDSNNTEEREEKKRQRFTPPTLEEVKAYIAEKHLAVDPEQFFNYFTEGEWHDSSGKSVRNWKQKLITWEKYEAPKKSEKPVFSAKEMEPEEELDINELRRKLFPEDYQQPLT